eukprot:4222612-Ditylum_brightwellii.AAC.1
MNANQDKPGIISWWLWRKPMKLWADEDTLCQPLGNQHVQWTPAEGKKTVKVKTTVMSVTWQGTYCYGITGDIIHRTYVTMDKYKATFEKWEQEIINNVETLVSLDKLIALMQQGQCLIATDSSASDTMMSFASKFADINSNAYVCHSGLAFGKELSFRPEAYDVVSVLCFIH